MGQTKLLIVDDHPLFRQGLVDVIETDPTLQVVAQAADGDVALAQARDHQPDVALMDISLPNTNGLVVTQQIMDELPRTKVVILTGYDESGYILQALDAGAVAFCTKDVPPDGLLSLIRTISDGHYFVAGQPMTAEEVAQWRTDRNGRSTDGSGVDGALLARLSPRETEILELLAQGSSNRDIAYKLNISQQTVKNHMTAILRKLQVGDRTQAAVMALRNGWVTLDPQVR